MQAGSYRWFSVGVGLVAMVLGAALTLKPFSSLEALTIYIAASLVVAGVGELLAGGRAPARIAGGLLVVAGVLALALPGLTVGAVALVVGIAMVLSGIARLVEGIHGSAEERLAAIVGGLASVIFGVLALAWPDLTVLVVAVLVGPVAVVLGAGQVIRALRSGRPAARHEPPGRWRRAWHVARGAAALAFALVLVALSAFLHSGTPSLDSFYTASAAIPARPGALIRSDGFTRAIPRDAKAVRILYTTSDSDGKIQPASGLVVAPEHARGPVPVVLWTHGTTGVARKCAPSALAQPFEAGALFILQRVIDHGWALVAPDYPGLGAGGEHPYLVGVPEARSALDAVRAARALSGFRLSDKTVAWGHSQGGGAALWVGEQDHAYAPDVPLEGVAALAPASDVLSLAGGLENSPAGMLFAALVVKGYSDTYPDVKFTDYVRPGAQTAVEQLVGRCLSEKAILASLPTVLTGQNVFTQKLTAGPLGMHLRENVPDKPTGIPTLLAQGLDDPLVLPAAQRAFAAKLCRAGQPLDYRTYAGRDHVALVADDSPLIPDLLRWTADRFRGTPAPAGCDSQQR